MKLKDFQEKTLQVLTDFAQQARASGPLAAFESDGAPRGWYRSPRVDNRPVLAGDPPYVCVRVPTGGGKTILAARAVGPLLQHGLEQDCGIVLWLVPSTAIADQTLKALRNPRHAYRRALAEGLGGEAIQVHDLAGALALSRAEARGETVVIVATLQSFRVGDTEGRKVYEDSGALYAFREDLRAFQARQPGILESIEGADEPRCSLRNVLAMEGPLVILDEAHNARTALSFDTLARLRPAWLLELTATPDRDRNASNVLHKVFASELKLAGMIKLPIELEAAADAEDALVKAKTKRDWLEAIAQNVAGRYLRPICLIQAEPDAHGNVWNVAAVLSYLKDTLGIPADQVVEHTGKQRGTGGRNLFSPKETIRFIVTQKALVEGWDCSFAYVLCALATSHSAKDVEQVLGRIMRQPDAEAFEEAPLNRAYGVVRTTSFLKTVNELRERFVVVHGFEGVTPNQIIQEPGAFPGFDEPHAGRAPALVILEDIDLTRLAPEVLKDVKVEGDGKITMTPTGFAQHFPAIRTAAKNPAAVSKAAQLHLTLSQQGTAIRVPLLLYQGQPFQERSFSVRPLPLNELSADLEFNVLGVRQTATLDAQGQTLSLVLGDSVREPELPYVDLAPESANTLAWHLDVLVHRQGKHADVPQALGRSYCDRVIAHLQGQGHSIAEIERARFRLATAISARWETRRQELRTKAWQASLLNLDAFSSSPSSAFLFRSEDQYLPARTCSRKFKRHLYGTVGEMNGEELQLAQVLDAQVRVKAWVRNLDPANRGNPQVSFWLQRATDKFYPDFVAVLEGGRTVVIEYKGDHLDDTADSRDKRTLGRQWQSATGGLFEWITLERLEGLAERWAELFAEK
jgi:type III restriction enzyme